MNLYSYQFERVPWPVVVEHLPNQPWLEGMKKHPTENKVKMKLSTKYNECICWLRINRKRKKIGITTSHKPSH